MSLGFTTFVVGARTMDSIPRTLPAKMQQWATTEPDKPAFIFVDAARNRTVLTLAEVFRLSSRYAAILRRNGLQHGHLVCNTLPNSPQRLLTDMGVQMAGGVAMNGQLFLADGKDFLGSLREAACFAVILDPREPRGAARVLEHTEHTTHGKQVDFPELPALKRVFETYMEGNGEHKTLFDVLNEETESYVADITPDDMADIWTTSGSTGFSKLVPRSHDGVLTFGETFYNFVHPEPGDIYYNDRSLGWAGGFPGIYLTHGITRVLLDLSKGVPDDMIAFEWEVMCHERCTVAFLVPSQLLQMTDRCSDQKEGQWKLRIIATGGQPLRRKHMEAIGKLTECVHVGYVSTETGMISSKVVTDKTTYEDCNNGFPVSGVQLRFVDKELEDASVGEMGEILIKSPQLAGRYFNNPNATERAFTSDGWYRTGDVGYLNDKGEVFTVCRLAFSIIRGPYLVYPGWLERRISNCPGVEDVMIIPVPDPTMYQELCACIVPLPEAQLTSEGVKDYCSKLFLTSEKSEMTAVPKYYVFFDAFPVTSTGKTCRRSTGVIARKRLGFGEDLLPTTS